MAAAAATTTTTTTTNYYYYYYHHHLLLLLLLLLLLPPPLLPTTTITILMLEAPILYDTLWSKRTQHTLLYSFIIHTFSPSLLERAIDVQVCQHIHVHWSSWSKVNGENLGSWNRHSDKQRLSIRVSTETASIWALEEAFWIGGTTGAGWFVSLATLVKTKEDGIQRVLVIEVMKCTCVVNDRQKQERG